ncbi:SpoIIE family protein phosphatase [Neosynechococcus sphagnicola]|uniref:SpoIIE family protein phosphatase n=1 Tax=Neosynechococcus sphagnicola TaxID=1501145 RepID=UPI000A819F11|nr:SpoIIE family protein phosphatase [Neosynechococcus sphagnicola]
MNEIAQAHINTVAHEIEGKFMAMEQSFVIPIQILQKGGTDQDYNPIQDDGVSLSSLLKILVEQHPNIQEVALVNIPNYLSAITAIGWQFDRQKSFKSLNKNEAKIWQTHCHIKSITSSTQPFWTQPYLLENSSGSPSITYCIPLFKPSHFRRTATNKLLAIEVSLNWLSPFLAQQLTQSDPANYLSLGDPFVLSPANGQWIVKPGNPKKVESWFSEKSYTLSDHQQGRSFINARINSQGTLIETTVPSQKWVIGILFPTEKLEKLQQQYLWLVIFSMSKDMVLMCVVIALISQLTTRPLRALIITTEEMAQGNLNTNLPPVTSVDEVGRLTQSFRRMRDSLLLHIHNLKETTAAKQKLESELSIAAQIQRTMVPRTNVLSAPSSPYEISALLKPARFVGGDFYDFFLLGSDRLCLIIGDVAGKGFPAALLMARTITLIRTLTKISSTPQDILSTVNQELCRENEECLFVTIFCGVLDLDTGKFIFASGGHDAPLLMRHQQVQHLELVTASPLGLYEDSVFSQNECVLVPNDLILFYTDGITEAMNSQGELFSETRLVKLMTYYPPTSSLRAVRTVEQFCQKFVGNAPQSDDITLFALKYLPSSPFSQAENVMKWHLTLNSKLTELEAARQYLGKILQAAHLKMELIEDAQFILEEILVNIIQYGYENRSDGYIDLRIEINTQQLRMIFEDNGKPFNPLTEILPPDLTMNDEQRSQGGLGVFFGKSNCRAGKLCLSEWQEYSNGLSINR